MADSNRVTIRHKITGEEKQVNKTALPFFVQAEDFEVLDAKGRVSGSATAAAKKEN